MTLVEGEKHDLSKHDLISFEAPDGSEQTCLGVSSVEIGALDAPEMQ